MYQGQNQAQHVALGASTGAAAAGTITAGAVTVATASGGVTVISGSILGTQIINMVAVAAATTNPIGAIMAGGILIGGLVGGTYGLEITESSLLGLTQNTVVYDVSIYE